MEGPMTTRHVYDVPPEVARRCEALADLIEGFGPRALPVPERKLRELARQLLGKELPDLNADPLEVLLMETVRLCGHQVFVLQCSGPVVQGCLLLVPVRNVQGVLGILHEAHLSLCA